IPTPQPPPSTSPVDTPPPQQAVSSTFLDKLVGAESSGNPTAKAKTSSAFGAAQFTNATWLEYVQKYRPELMVGKTKGQILKMRADPQLSREMAQHYADDN